jgi:hypothetical protein
MIIIEFFGEFQQSKNLDVSHLIIKSHKRKFEKESRNSDNLK